MDTNIDISMIKEKSKAVFDLIEYANEFLLERKRQTLDYAEGRMIVEKINNQNHLAELLKKYIETEEFEKANFILSFLSGLIYEWETYISKNLDSQRKDHREKTYNRRDRYQKSIMRKADEAAPNYKSNERINVEAERETKKQFLYKYRLPNEISQEGNISLWNPSWYYWLDIDNLRRSILFTHQSTNEPSESSEKDNILLYTIIEDIDCTKIFNILSRFEVESMEEKDFPSDDLSQLENLIFRLHYQYDATNEEIYDYENQLKQYVTKDFINRLSLLYGYLSYAKRIYFGGDIDYLYRYSNAPYPLFDYINKNDTSENIVILTIIEHITSYYHYDNLLAYNWLNYHDLIPTDCVRDSNVAIETVLKDQFMFNLISPDILMLILMQAFLSKQFPSKTEKIDVPVDWTPDFAETFFDDSRLERKLLLGKIFNRGILPVGHSSSPTYIKDAELRSHDKNIFTRLANIPGFFNLFN